MIAEPVAPDAPVQPEPFVVIGQGPRNARTDASGLRFYTWQGRELPSATTIRRLAGVPHDLHQWAINQVIARATTKVWTLVKMLTRKRRPRERVLEKNRLEEASKWLRIAATEERDASAKLGIAVHDAAATNMDPASVADDVRPRLLQFRDWLVRSGAAVLAAEFQIFNLTVGYAGTGDLLVRFPNGQVWLIDLKTGKSTFAEHALQVMYYRQGEFVGADDVVNPWLTELLRSVAGMAVLHLADDHWEFRAIRHDQETWEAAQGLLRFAMWSHLHQDVESVTVALRRSA